MTNKKNNTFCSICGKGYYVCRSCKEQTQLQPWKIHTDTSEHFKIFQIIRGYSIGLYTKDEARDKFKNIDLSDVENLLPNIKSIIKDILADEISEENAKENADKSTEEDNVKIDEYKVTNENKKAKRHKSRDTDECR